MRLNQVMLIKLLLSMILNSTLHGRWINSSDFFWFFSEKYENHPSVTLKCSHTSCTPLWTFLRQFQFLHHRKLNASQGVLTQIRGACINWVLLICWRPLWSYAAFRAVFGCRLCSVYQVSTSSCICSTNRNLSRPNAATHVICLSKRFYIAFSIPIPQILKTVTGCFSAN